MEGFAEIGHRFKEYAPCGMNEKHKDIFPLISGWLYLLSAVISVAYAWANGNKRICHYRSALFAPLYNINKDQSNILAETDK